MMKGKIPLLFSLIKMGISKPSVLFNLLLKKENFKVLFRALKYEDYSLVKKNFENRMNPIINTIVPKHTLYKVEANVKRKSMNLDLGKIKVLIAVLSFNYGKKIIPLIESLKEQKLKNGIFDIMVIDSSTDDISRKIVKDIDGISCEFIPSNEFSHGSTRQYVMNKAMLEDNDIVAFIVQDALPLNDKWLTNLLEPFKLYDDMACVFGKQIPYLNHNPIAKSWVKGVFEDLSPEDKMIIHSNKEHNIGNYWNSNVNAAYRVSFFKDKLSFPNINYAEDQAIAKSIIDQGLKKAYAPTASVYHSHNLKTPFNQFQRFFDDYYGVKESVGYPGDQVTFIKILPRAIHAFLADVKNISKQNISFLSTARWSVIGFFMSIYRFIALYFACNLENRNRSLFFRYLSRDEMRKQLKKDELNIIEKIFAHLLIGYYLFIFPLYGLKSLFKKIFFSKTNKKAVQRESVVQVQNKLSESISYKEKVTVPSISNEVNIRKMNNDIKINYTNPYYHFIHLFDPAKEVRVSNSPKPSKTVSWIIPDFGIGGGGHMIIFRMAAHLEKNGYQNLFYVVPPKRWRDESTALNVINEHYFPFKGAILEYIDTTTPQIEDSEFLIATDWSTTYLAYPIQNVNHKIHFIQDFEPYFFAKGADYLIAEQAYRMGYNFISNSKWLYFKISSEYALKGDFIELGYDAGIYKMRKEFSEREHAIAFYSRDYTSRRAVQFGFIALEQLVRMMPNLKIYLFGDNNISNELPNNFVNLGLLNFKELSDLYNKCKLGLALSATNYSIIPQEMNACGLPVVDLEFEGNRTNYGKRKGVVLVEPNIHLIARKIFSLLNDEYQLKELSESAISEAKEFTWEKAGEKFKSILKTYN